MVGLLLSYLDTFISLAAAILTIIFYKKSLFDNFSSDAEKIGVIFIGLFAFIFFFNSIFLKIRLARRARYAEVLSLLNKGFENIHKIIREENVTLDFLISSLQNLCTQLSVAFRKITNNRCAVCIKILSEGKGENKRKLKIDTLCRDIHSHSDRSFSDNKEHLVEKNTDFSNILQNVDRPEGRYFISIYIPFHQKYENSSIDFYAGKKWKFIPFHNLQNFFRKFALPYKSTIVVPICPGISTERSEKTLLGFLCVDSPNFYNFKKHFDADILNGVADGLYNIILKLKEKI